MQENKNFNFVISALLELYPVSNRFFEKENVYFELKKDGSYVTECDITHNDIIIKHLGKTGIDVFSEESKIPLYEERKDLKQYWIVDPLDGTYSFMKKKNDFGVLIALLVDRRPILSFLYFPILDVLYFAQLGFGTYILSDFYKKFKKDKLVFNEVFNSKNRIRVIMPSFDDKLKIMLSKKLGVDEEKTFLDKIQKQKDIDSVRQSACRRFVLLLKGNFHFSFRFHPIFEWDLVVGDLLLNEAGMCIRTMNDEKILYNTPNFSIPNVLGYFKECKHFLE